MSRCSNSGYVGAPYSVAIYPRMAARRPRGVQARAPRFMAMGVGRVYPVSLDPAEPNDLNDTVKRVAA